MNDSPLNLYRKRVLEHHREPRNRRRAVDADRQVVGFNPLCGDKLTVYITLNEDELADVAFEGTGCAISIASASMMTEVLAGADAETARQLVTEVEKMFAGNGELTDPRLEELKSLGSVKQYPSRIKCATLAWRAAANALQDKSEQVTTE